LWLEFGNIWEARGDVVTEFLQMLWPVGLLVVDISKLALLRQEASLLIKATKSILN